MTFALGQLSLTRAAHVDPSLMRVVNLAISRSPIDFGCTEDQSRTVAQQAAKVAAGVSQVTGKQARHMIQPDGYSKAIDLVPWIGGAFDWGDPQWSRMIDGQRVYLFSEIAEVMRAAAVQLGVKVRWGGCWDHALNDLAPGVPSMRAATAAYIAKRRAAGHKSSMIDGPHFELPL